MERLGQRTEETGIRINLPEDGNRREIKRTGVVLIRSHHHEGDIFARLFLRETGTVGVYVPGAAKHIKRFGGALEPLVWGHYQLYRSRRRLYIREIEVTDDMWELRKRPRAMRRAIRWGRMLWKYLLPGYPYDTELIHYYWALKALCDGVSADVVEARFIWLWLLDWGLAPDLLHCSECGSTLISGQAYERRGEGYICSSCARGEPRVRIDAFRDYAMSRSFVPEHLTPELEAQSQRILPTLKKNLVENK